MTEIANSWHLKLFSKSVLKQAKLKNLCKWLPDTSDKRCLDLGSDNGVISYYLRQRGGEWFSADLSEETVSSIRSLVGERVSLISGDKLPYEDDFFDVVVVVDMLEHVKDDAAFAQELARVCKPGATLIINAPNLKPYSPLRGFRELVGQGDKEHGHLRPGYAQKEIANLFGSDFTIERSETYSKVFSESIDTKIVLAYRILSSLTSGGKGEEKKEEVSKGLVMTEDKMKSFEKSFKLYSLIYPFVKSVSKLDSLLPFVSGFMRLTVLKRVLPLLMLSQIFHNLPLQYI